MMLFTKQINDKLINMVTSILCVFEYWGTFELPIINSLLLIFSEQFTLTTLSNWGLRSVSLHISSFIVKISFLRSWLESNFELLSQQIYDNENHQEITNIHLMMAIFQLFKSKWRQMTTYPYPIIFFWFNYFFYRCSFLLFLLFAPVFWIWQT